MLGHWTRMIIDGYLPQNAGPENLCMAGAHFGGGADDQLRKYGHERWLYLPLNNAKTTDILSYFVQLLMPGNERLMAMEVSYVLD